MRDNYENTSIEKELIKTTKHKQAIAAAIMEKLQPGDPVLIPRHRPAGRTKDSCTQQWPDRLPSRGIVECITPSFVAVRMLDNENGRPLYRECFRPENIAPEEGGVKCSI